MKLPAAGCWQYEGSAVGGGVGKTWAEASKVSSFKFTMAVGLVGRLVMAL